METQDSRLEIATKFLLQSPPGEVNDVLHDVREIVQDDDALQPGVISALETYNLEQFTTFPSPDGKYQILISDAARLHDEDGNLVEDRYMDPRSKLSFKFDHLKLEVVDTQPLEVDESTETFRDALETTTLKYVGDHYTDGVVGVFSITSPFSWKPKYALQFVANKYNPPNFWSGRWRSSYTIDFNISPPLIAGEILVNVHYYEAGNVQLSTSLTLSSPLPDSLPLTPTSAQKILTFIAEKEKDYQRKLGEEIYEEMSERTFKYLRRNLPITKQKVEWDRVMGYKLGQELSSSNKNIFGSSSSGV